MHLHSTFEDTAAANAWTGYQAADKALLSAALLTLSLLPAPPAAPLAAAVLATALAVGAARIPAARWLSSLAPLWALAAVGALPLLWMDGGSTRAAHLAARAAGSSASILLLAATTPAAELLHALARIGPARAFAELAFLILRWFALLAESARSMATAWYCRGSSRPLASLLFALRASAALFARAALRTRRLDNGLALRAGPGALLFWAPARAAAVPLRLLAASLLLAACALRIAAL